MPTYKRFYQHLLNRLSHPYIPRISVVILLLLSLLISLHHEGQVIRSTIPEESVQGVDELQFYNFDPALRNGRAKTTLEKAKYPKGGPVIATLVSSKLKDIENLCTTLRSLSFIQGDQKKLKTPVLIFNEGNISPYHVGLLIDNTDRPIAFPTVDFNQFPNGFNPDAEHAEFVVPGRSKWGYYQAMRFWVTGIWKHPALKPFETVMRLDSDSCFKKINNHLPNFQRDHIAYHSQYVGMEPATQYVDGLMNFTTEYLKRIQKEPNNQMLWNMAEMTWKAHGTLPLFMTNFEIVRKGFMQRGDVSDFNEALTEKDPFGFFRHRWSDAVIRFLTMAIFATNDMVMTSKAEGYNHRLDCGKKGVNQALREFLYKTSTPTSYAFEIH